MQLRAYYTDLGGCLFPDFLDAACDILAATYDSAPDRLELAKRALWERYAYDTQTVADAGADSLTERQAWGDFAVQAGIDATPEEMVSMAAKCASPLDPNYEALLKSLQARGIILGVISNNTRFFWARQRAAMRLERFFPPERVILSCDYGVAKKSPGLELFIAAAASAGVAPEACVFVDDRAHNVEMALRAGFRMAVLHPKLVNWGAEYIARILAQAGVL